MVVGSANDGGDDIAEWVGVVSEEEETARRTRTTRIRRAARNIKNNTVP